MNRLSGQVKGPNTTKVDTAKALDVMLAPRPHTVTESRIEPTYASASPSVDCGAIRATYNAAAAAMNDWLLYVHQLGQAPIEITYRAWTHLTDAQKLAAVGRMAPYSGSAAAVRTQVDYLNRTAAQRVSDMNRAQVAMVSAGCAAVPVVGVSDGRVAGQAQGVTSSMAMYAVGGAIAGGLITYAWMCRQPAKRGRR